MSATRSTTHRTLDQWFTAQEWRVQSFQREVWAHMAACRSGLLNAPTGSGKTYAVWGGVVNSALLNVTPGLTRSRVKGNGATPGQARSDNTQGLRAIWITPLRALAGEIAESAQRMCDGVGLDWKVGVRTGDTSTKERAAQKKALPQLLVTTPESLHVLLATKGYAELFKYLDWFIADEWHELLGSKRGVQVELALSRLKALRPQLGGIGQRGNLHTRVVVIELARHVPALRGVQVAHRVAQRRLSAVAHVKRAGGVGRDKFDHELAAVGRLHAKAGAACQHLADDLLLGLGLEFDVDEAGPGDIDGLDPALVGRGGQQRRAQVFSHLARVELERLGQLHCGGAGEIAMRCNLGRFKCSTRTGTGR